METKPKPVDEKTGVAQNMDGSTPLYYIMKFIVLNEKKKK